jgi:hypothetical protein
MAVSTIDAPWRAIGQICNHFTPQEFLIEFAKAGYRFE